VKFDFKNYVKMQKDGTRKGGLTASSYAYSVDRKMLAGLSTLVPVRMACEAYLRTYKDVARGNLLGNAVRVGKSQFTRLFGIVSDCARSLSIPIPEVFVVQNPVINAYTYGTNDDSYIVVNSATVDHLEDDELKFIVGHECGHIHCEHVTYYSLARDLANIGSYVIGWIVAPATFALDAWSRRSEISADRAGLICCRCPETAKRSLVKVALGSQKLYEEIDVPEFLSQMSRLEGTLGKWGEVFSSHPYLPKRVKALELFENSEPYYACLRQSGNEDGSGKSADGEPPETKLWSFEDLDEKVSDIIAVMGGRKDA
jgi:Zn-dependent protease with chaperone function